MAERQFGPYKLVRQIAVGGMAEIHLAKTAGIAGFEKYVALKMIHPNFAEDEQFIQMLVDEAKIAVQLTHGNIAQTFDLGRVGETYYITMEYVDGADLYKILRRASEQDVETPLDVCAFIGKEVSSALDHAHRKRDHTGKSLGIVHRDVSPQNVLVSYSGEVKLVDFGIAKATMKVRQTAVGVIKGKYYYMSPEQAWGDPIDHRSDIFSAGIVLYEMITGQMLYLEEDLHKLLEMARKAEIAPPSKLRRGVPPQLERIVMNALAKQPGERYQSAGDLATDLERFLHAYQPAFTAAKLSTLLRQVIGEPIQVPDDPGFVSIEFRDGVMSTHPLDDSEVAHAIDRDAMRDENSVIFRLQLDKRPTEPPVSGEAPTELPGQAAPVSQAPPRASTPPPRPGTSRIPTPPPTPAVRQSVPVPRVTRPADPLPAPPAPRVTSTAKLPAARPPQVTKPRQPHEETRPLVEPAPPNPLHDDSGLLTPDGQKLSWLDSDHSDTSSEFDNIGERTMVTAPPGMTGGLAGFMMDVAGDDGDGQVEATLVTMAPTGPGFGNDSGFGSGQDSTAETATGDTGAGEAPGAPGAPNGIPRAVQDDRDHRDDDDDEDGPTLSRDLTREPPPAPRQRLRTPPPALAAKIHAPAVSELRKPRPSRRTPPGGTAVPGSSVLQAIVGARTAEPMPAPRASSSALPPPPLRDALAPTLPPENAGSAAMQPTMVPGQHQMPSLPAAMQPTLMPGQHLMPPGLPGQPAPYTGPFPVGTPLAQPSYNHDASGMPLGMPTPPGVPVPPGMPYPVPGAYPSYAGQPLANQVSPHGYPQMSPGALYQFQPAPQPMSLTGQIRLLEVDEIPAQYKLGTTGKRWFTYIASGMLAISVAAGVTFLIIRSTQDTAPTTGSVHLVSVPSGAEVSFDGTRLTEHTPLTVDQVPVGTRHKITISLPHYQAHSEEVDIPKTGQQVSVTAQLSSVSGKLAVNTIPGGAEIWINGQMRGITPTTLTGIDIDSTASIELRHKEFPPHQVLLKWDPEGRASVEFRFTH